MKVAILALLALLALAPTLLPAAKAAEETPIVSVENGSVVWNTGPLLNAKTKADLIAVIERALVEAEKISGQGIDPCKGLAYKVWIAIAEKRTAELTK